MPTAHVKITANQVLRFFPFLADLLTTAGISGRRKIKVIVKTTPVKIDPPYHDGVSRFSSGGALTGKAVSHFVGSLDTAANAPTEMVAAGSSIEGRSVNPGCFYAVFDLMEFYGLRELTLYLQESDLDHASPELRNQLCLQS